MSDQRSDETPQGSSPDDAWRPTANAGEGVPTGDQRPVWTPSPDTTAPATPVTPGAGPAPRGDDLPDHEGVVGDTPTEQIPQEPGGQPTEQIPTAPTQEWTGGSQGTASWSGATADAGYGQPSQGQYGGDPYRGAEGYQSAPGYQGAQSQNPWASPQSSTFQAPAARTSTRKRRGAPGWLALLVAMIITALVSVGGTYALVGSRTTATSTPVTAASSTQTSATTVSPVTSTGDSADWEAVASAVSPAVVTITVDTSSSESVGSGVIFDSSGHVVTNYHVISEMASSSALTTGGSSSSATMTITLSDGRVYQGSVVGEDTTTDLAVVQIENAPSDLTVASFGSSSDLTVGQQVMAIGAPLGLSNTVTTGIISALNRPVEVSTSDSSEDDQQSNPNDPFGQLPGTQQSQTSSTSVVTNAIQVDASINPGNSGGPLFDETGAVIGINSSIASTSSSSDTAGSIGLGFAIPVDLVKSVVDQLISTGTVDHAVLGVTIQSATATVDGTTESGAEIASVSSGSGAEKAGLKKGDVILSVDGNAVTSAKSLTGFIRTYKGGDQVTLVYVRDGQKESVAVTLQSTE